MTSNQRRAALTLALTAFTAGLSLEAAGQRSVPAGIVASARDTSVRATGDFANRLDAAPIVAAPRPMKPFLVGGAIVGAVVGALLATSFNDSFCGEPGPGYSCSSTSPVAGAMIGAGVGVFAGWLLWAVSNSGGSSARGSSR